MKRDINDWFWTVIWLALAFLIVKLLTGWPGGY